MAFGTQDGDAFNYVLVRLQCACELLLGDPARTPLSASAAARLAACVAQFASATALMAPSGSGGPQLDGWAQHAWASAATCVLQADPVAHAAWPVLMQGAQRLAERGALAIARLLEELVRVVEAPAFLQLAKSAHDVLDGVMAHVRRNASRLGLFAAMSEKLGSRLLTACGRLRGALVALATAAAPQPEQLVGIVSAIGGLQQSASHVSGCLTALSAAPSPGPAWTAPATAATAGGGLPPLQQSLAALHVAAEQAQQLQGMARAPWSLYRLSRRLSVCGQHAAAAPLFEHVARCLEGEQQKTWCLALAKAARAEGLLAEQGWGTLGHASSQLLEAAAELSVVANKARRLQLQRRYWVWRARFLQLLADMLALQAEDDAGRTSLSDAAAAVLREGDSVRQLMAAADGDSLVLLGTQQRLARAVASLTLPEGEGQGLSSAAAALQPPGNKRRASTVHAPLAQAAAALEEAVLRGNPKAVWRMLQYVATMPVPWPTVLFRPSHEASLQLGLQASKAYGGIGGMPTSLSGSVGTVKVGAGTDLVLDLDGLVTGLEKRALIQAQIRLQLSPKHVPQQAAEGPAPQATEADFTCEVGRGWGGGRGEGKGK